jgi:hypothetical protein
LFEAELSFPNAFRLPPRAGCGADRVPFSWRSLCTHPAGSVRNVIFPSPEVAVRVDVMLTLAPALVALLDVLQFRHGVSIEVVDASLRPAQPAGAADFAGMLEEPGVRERCLAALRSGEGRVERGLPIAVGIYPLRAEREVLGLLLVARRRTRGDAPLDQDEFRHLEAAGQVARAVVESELVRGQELARAADRSRRLKGILRFIGQLAAGDSEREMMQAVVQAATVWFDLDCRIYNREADGDFALFAALPGIARHEMQHRLDGRRFQDMPKVRRLTSSADLDMVAWSGRRDEVLVFSVGTGPDWLIILTGVLDPEVEVTFAAIAHVIAGELRQTMDRRIEHWRARLRVQTVEAERPPEAVVSQMLADVAAAVGAEEARATFHRRGAQRTFLGTPAGAQGRESAIKHARRVPVGFQAHVEIELRGPAEPFGFEALATVDAWVAAVQPWLSGMIAGDGDSSLLVERTDEFAFEQRVHDEVERAKRFDLGLSLLVIDPAEITAPSAASGSRVLDAIRSELRASDLFGRIRGGMLAVVLVHADPEGVQSVAKRLRRTLGSLVNGTHKAAVRLGQAVFSSECKSADALIRQALQRLDEVNSGG